MRSGQSARKARKARKWWAAAPEPTDRHCKSCTRHALSMPRCDIAGSHTEQRSQVRAMISGEPLATKSNRDLPDPRTPTARYVLIASARCQGFQGAEQIIGAPWRSGITPPSEQPGPGPPCRQIVSSWPQRSPWTPTNTRKMTKMKTTKMENGPYRSTVISQHEARARGGMEPALSAWEVGGIARF